MKKIGALLSILLCLPCGAFAEDVPGDGGDLIVSPSLSNYLLAGAGVVASNATLFLFNHFVMRAEYADISAETIRANFCSAWVWDQDTFHVNQLGHPYQGSFYFTAARSNGIPFEAALLYNVLGSVSWEYICENETPSINDLIVTTMGGAAVGEMLHRLYLEARDAKFPLSFILSPMDALMGLITGTRPAQSEGDGVESFSTVIGMGPLWSSVSFSDSRAGRYGFYPVNFYGGMSVVYGNPYRAPHWKPYASFEFDIMGGGY